jgi:hypothetical protein
LTCSRAKGQGFLPSFARTAALGRFGGFLVHGVVPRSRVVLPALRRRLASPPVLRPGFVGSVGGAPLSTVHQYIEQQNSPA